MIAAAAWTARLLEKRDESEGVRTFRLSVPDGFDFLPGMWAMFHFSDAPKTARAYSLASSPLERGHVEITMSRVGEFSERFFGLREGDEVEAKGPYGKWVFTGELAPAALVSGGTGITPFRSMARYAVAKGLHAELSLFYSTKTASDVIYGDELAEFARSGMKIHHTVTRERRDGPTGRITVELLRRELPRFAATHFFLCGPAKLVDDLSKGLAAAGLPMSQIHREVWGDYQL
jgi:glycine betaine catabolism B